MITLSLVFGALVLILSTLGFGTVFEQLHIWIFPDGHKWNFYYQDSLMSTLMWAPNLFLYIAIAWLIIAIILLALILKASKFLYEYFNLMSLAKETSAMRINSSTLKNTQPIDS